MNDLSLYIEKLSQKNDLSFDEMKEALDLIVQKNLPDQEIITFLEKLHQKKESIDEIAGAISYLRTQTKEIVVQSNQLMDVCGTGGDGKNTFNISTAVSFILAGLGIKIAKHGNRSISSKSGSADILSALGININTPAEKVAQCIDKIGIGFLFAPHYHPAMQKVASARKKMAKRSIFNILGPTINPLHPAKQVIGVFDKSLLPLLGEAMIKNGSQAIAIVHGQDGMDEITLTGKTDIYFYKENQYTEIEFDPKEVGYDYCHPSQLEGSTPEENAKRLKRVLKGHSEPLDHCIHLNAALAVILDGKADNFKAALLEVQQSISSGLAYQKLEQLIELTNQS